jgi:hypothetical protein
MSQIFRKIELSPSDWEAKKKLIQLSGTNPQGEAYSYWNPELIVLVYEIGHICTEMGKDDKGFPTCVKQSEKVAVDIVWKDEVHPDFIAHLVWPKPCGIHSLGATLDNEYAAAYCAANPTSEYCQPPKPIEL